MLHDRRCRRSRQHCRHHLRRGWNRTGDQVLQQVTGSPVTGKIVMLVLIILFLQWKPGGLFVNSRPQPGLISCDATAPIRNCGAWRAAFILIVLLPCLNAFTPRETTFCTSAISLLISTANISATPARHQRGFALGLYRIAESRPGALFSLGGYMMGMYLMRMIGDLGQYHKPIPDFLVFLGWSTLAGILETVRQFSVCHSDGVLSCPAASGARFRLPRFSLPHSRSLFFHPHPGSHLCGACLLFFRNSLLLGGNNGFTDFKFILGYDLRSPATQRGLYIVTAVSVVAGFSRLPLAEPDEIRPRATSDSRQRKPRSLQWVRGGIITSCLCSFSRRSLARIGGMLFVPQVGIINPSEMAPGQIARSRCLGRGRRSRHLLGPILGAFGVNAFKSWATRAYPDMWLIFLGALFVLVTLFMPEGLVGLPGQLRGVKKRFDASPRQNENRTCGRTSSRAIRERTCAKTE